VRCIEAESLVRRPQDAVCTTWLGKPLGVSIAELGIEEQGIRRKVRLLRDGRGGRPARNSLPTSVVGGPVAGRQRQW
jgi:hypothetical protein